MPDAEPAVRADIVKVMDLLVLFEESRQFSTGDEQTMTQSKGGGEGAR